MDSLAKIHLSQEEKELVQNTRWIFSKRLILKKAEHLLTALQQEYQEMLQDYPAICAGLAAQRSKIARGENYKGLPYLMLDYPALFEKNGILAIRTMFWWGNYFSCTLHISGNYMRSPKETVQWIDYFANQHFFVNVHDQEWEHHFEADNYLPAKALSNEQVESVSGKNFFKAGFTSALENFEEVAPAMLHAMHVYLTFLETNSLLNGEINL